MLQSKRRLLPDTRLQKQATGIACSWLGRGNGKGCVRWESVAAGAAIAPPERFNLFALEEQMSQAKHPEVEAEKRKMVANRGDQKTQTSDAKFDERFKFAHGLTGSSSQPW
ncbi:hypothetical protein APUTEX25_005549 [Auxenochlorella protothecoides]|nr:hypothetical protein APUTEX25_005549 [Auxenochlorella protothecoides]|eukprot:RMZ55271.1 hypothetical protein APUTEX25_005549 [Auxenochlorella protothecoides]